MNLETKITIYKFTPQVFTLTRCLYSMEPAAMLLPYSYARVPIIR